MNIDLGPQDKSLQNKQGSALFDFLLLADKLKCVKRYGSNKNMADADRDSAADHSWRLALMVFAVASEFDLKLDVTKAMGMALIHDIAESISGDVDYRDIVSKKITPEQKKSKEDSAMKIIFQSMPPKLRKNISALYKEYELKKSEEAKFVKALDRIETTSHLLNTGKKSYNTPDIIATYPNASAKEFPKIESFIEEMKNRLKNEFIKNNIPWKSEYDITKS